MQGGTEDLAGRSVLVTGGSGFVGAALVPLLAAAGCAVACFGRRAPPHPARHLPGDLRDGASLAAGFAAARPEVVIHLAGAAVPPPDAGARRAMLELNVMGTEAVLAAAAGVGAQHVVVVGSAAQYGPLPAPRHALTEDDPCRPVGLYGISKAAAGALALDFGRGTGLAVTLAVPFNVIGPGQASHMVPATFIAQLVGAPGAGAVRIAVGDTSAERDWVDVRDVARAIVLLAARRATGPFNICTGRAVPVAALLGTLRELSARPFDWTTDAARLRPEQPSVHRGDPARIMAATGWHAQIGLRTTLADMLRAAGGDIHDTERRIA
jgi:GDP-4-dehydro-6-deoxy-D-mannose reductase